jgi:hypothetical protein
LPGKAPYEVGRARARLAAAKRHHPDDDHAELERDLEYANAEDRIKRIIDSWPPLSDEQLSKLAAIIHGGAGLAARPAEARRGGDAA